MKKSLMVIVAFVLIFTHIIPPLNISFANEKVNECENSDFTVQTIKEDDEKIVGTGMASDQLTVEFKTKNKTEVVNVDVNGKFELKVEEEFLELNDVILISNDYFKVETKIASEESSTNLLQSKQYIKCSVIEETSDSEDIILEETDTEEATDSENLVTKEPDAEEASESEDIAPEESDAEEASGSENLVPEEPDAKKASESEDIAPEESDTEEASGSENLAPEEPDNEEATESEDVVPEEPDTEENTSEMKGNIVKKNAPYESNIRYSRKVINNANITSAQTLTDVSLLNNIDITSSIDVEQPPKGTPYTLELSLSGSSLADVELIDTNRVVVFSIPELAGQMTATGPANVSVDLTLVNLGDLPILGNVVGGLTGTLSTTVNGVLSLVSNLENSLIPDDLITIEGIDELQGSLDALNNIEQSLADALQYNGTVPVTINADGTVIVDMTDGLGNNLETAVNGVVIQVLNDLIASLNGVSISILPEAESIPLLGLVVRGLNATINTTLSGLTGLAGDVANILDTLDVTGLATELARVQLLGSTNVDLNIAINNPVQFEPGTDNIVPVYSSVVNTAVIDANLIGNGTGQSEIIFPEQRDETPPVLNNVEIDKNSTEGYIVSGTGEEAGDRVEVTNEAGEIVGSDYILEDGNFFVDITGQVSPDEVLKVQANDKVGNKSEIHEVTVPILKLVKVPSEINFGNRDITNGEVIFGRESTESTIEIKDTRKDDDWILSAAAPDLSVNNNILQDALIYIRNGEEVKISTEANTVAESTDANVVRGEGSDTITWNNNAGSEDGLLLKVNPIEAVVGEEYTTTIEWTLTDGP